MTKKTAKSKPTKAEKENAVLAEEITKARAAASQLLNAARWNSPEWKSKKKRHEQHLIMVANIVNPGRKRSLDRCPCGLMTSYRAAKRNHKCTRAA